MADKNKHRFDIPVAVPPPAPPLVPFRDGRDLMKCPASLIGSEKAFATKRTVLDECKNVVVSRQLTEYSWFYYNNEVDAYLQDGPTCGLVVLKLASEMVKGIHVKNKCPDKEIFDLLQLARDSGFTRHGEMFSARDMSVLAKIYYQMNYKVVSSGLEDYTCLIHNILQGYPVLVPYDADRNNEPCLKKGHKAHWAVVTGFLLGFKNAPKHGENCNKINISRIDESSFPSHFESNTLFLITRHGKSRHYGIWSWNELYNSNNNLVEFERGDVTGNYLLTEGIHEGLCSKALFFNPEL